jgi:hypothetical protein
VDLTRSGTSTLQRAKMEDSSKEFLMPLRGEGSFGPPSYRQRNTGASFTPATTTKRKENALATMRFPLRMVAPCLETNHPSERHHAHHEGQLMQAHARHPPTKLGSVPWLSGHIDRQTATRFS